MPMLRFVKHEKFVREYIKSGGNGVRAYMKLWPDASYVSAKVGAARVLAMPHVKKRYYEVLAQMVKRTDITIEKILGDYQWVINEGKANGKLTDVKAAAEAQAKLVGLLRDRVETGQPGDFDTMENLSDILEAVAKDAGPEAALALSKALGLETNPEPSEADSSLAEAAPASDAVN